MTTRNKIYEKYKKSEIFQTNPDIKKKSRNEINLENNEVESFDNKEIKTKLRNYNKKYHESDIFNLNKTFDDKLSKTKKPKTRNKSFISTCFDSMKNNTQYKNDLKDYTKKKRINRTKFYPEKYFRDKNSRTIFYKQYYDKNIDPILFNVSGKLNKSVGNLDPNNTN